MNQSAKVIAHSVSAHGGPSILTLEIHIWRPLLAELNTHRALSNLSGSAASSRAVPAHKRIEAVRADPYTPKHWPANQPGMIGRTGEIEGNNHPSAIECRQVWREAAEMACYHAEKLADTGTHKANINRILEPFHTVPVVLTGTEDGWENFFALRTERLEDGTPVPDPEFCDLADEMLRVVRASGPHTLLSWHPWHVPYVTDDEVLATSKEDSLKLSAARCARVSYENHDGQRDIAKDIALHDRLLASGHMSPMEHQAKPWTPDQFGMCGNLHPSWVQYRKTLPNERRTFKIWEK